MQALRRDTRSTPSRYAITKPFSPLTAATCIPPALVAAPPKSPFQRGRFMRPEKLLRLFTIVGMVVAARSAKAQSCERVRVSLVEHAGATSDRPLSRLGKAAAQPDVFLRQDVSESDFRIAVLTARSMCPSRSDRTTVRVLDVSAEHAAQNANDASRQLWASMLTALRAATVREVSGYGTTRTITISLSKDGHPLP